MMHSDGPKETVSTLPPCVGGAVCAPHRFILCCVWDERSSPSALLCCCSWRTSCGAQVARSACAEFATMVRTAVAVHGADDAAHHDAAHDVDPVVENRPRHRPPRSRCSRTRYSLPLTRAIHCANSRAEDRARQIVVEASRSTTCVTPRSLSQHADAGAAGSTPQSRGTSQTYGAPFQSDRRTRSGDDILVSTPQGDFTYKVLPRPAVTVWSAVICS